MSAAPATRSASIAALGRGRLLWVVAGVLAIAGGTALGWDATLLEAVVRPPALVRAALVAVSVLLGLRLLRDAFLRLRVGSAADRPSAADGDGLDGTSNADVRRDPSLERAARDAAIAARDMPTLIRGVRLVFLAVAVFAAGVGWLVGHPLPFVVALVIAGVDILETSFLLLVVSLRREG